MEVGLLLLRVVVGGLFVGHGAQKLFGWFEGQGPDGTAQFFEGLGYQRPRRAAQVAGAAEFGGGVLLVLGLFTPLAAAAIIGVMVNAAVAAHLSNGLWNSQGGYELPVVFATAATALAFAGPGALALDTALGIMTGVAWGAIALILGIGAGLAVLSTLREAPLAEQFETEPAGEAETAAAEEEEEERIAA
jgi:putative oxidoreductase